MKVRIKPNWRRYYWDLDDADLRVLEMTATCFRVMNVLARPFLYMRQAFTVTDSILHDHWVLDDDGNGHPAAIGSLAFEDFFDGDVTAIRAVNDYVSERARSESFLAPKPKTRFFLARGGGVVTYSEVDEDDWEIRKVRVDSAVVAYINPVQGIGDLQLTNINAVTESQEISDCEFEEQWDRAQFASRSEEE